MNIIAANVYQHVHFHLRVRSREGDTLGERVASR